jgi:hypothetical protein
VSPSDVEGCWNEEKALDPIMRGDLSEKAIANLLEFGGSDYEDLHSYSSDDENHALAEEAPNVNKDSLDHDYIHHCDISYLNLLVVQIHSSWAYRYDETNGLIAPESFIVSGSRLFLILSSK